MTIALAWVRRNKSTKELIVATDSRLRSHGSMDQAQKIFRLDRGDCCLAFCGDTQVAFPLFIQVASSVNAFIKSRTRAQDVTDMVPHILDLLNNLIDSWDLPVEEKSEYLSATRILFAGWSWKCKRFEIGNYKYVKPTYEYHRSKVKLPHPWKEAERSLIFLGDYEKDYLVHLQKVLETRHPGIMKEAEKKHVDFDYEPLKALATFLDETKGDVNYKAIGGAPQLLKIYPFAKDLPVVVRHASDEHYLFGRRLFEWEKTEYPVITLDEAQPRFLYPMASIPLPKDLKVEASDE